MEKLIYLSIFQVLALEIVGFLRGFEVRSYVKEKGYRFKKKNFKNKLANKIISLIKMAIPFYGLFAFFIALFCKEESIFNAALELNLLEKIEE